MEEKLWVEKYRPKTVAECVLPAVAKSMFAKIVETGECQNLLLSGKPGTGKTTVARALMEEIGCDYMVINASLDRNIDVLRTEITQFASTVSFSGKKKFVILDEADYLNQNSTQPALRNFIEEYSSSCGFILTCNYPNKIMEPLRSRLFMINFEVHQSEEAKMKVDFSKRAFDILSAENVTFDKQVVMLIVNKMFPDFRKVLNELQGYSNTGAIDTGILSRVESLTSGLVKAIRDKSFNDARKWVGENSSADHTVIIRELFDRLSEIAIDRQIPLATIILAEYLYKSAFVADQEINTAACAARLIAECDSVS
jgi:DNA polymerase III delta prime subunit